MLGLMQDHPLLISTLIKHAALNHGDREIVSVGATGEIRRSNWREIERRSRRLAAALGRLGLNAGDRVATLAWNSAEHLELYFGATGAGIVLHTVNPRLFSEQQRFIIGHGGARVLFIDPALIALAEEVAPHLDGVEAFVFMGQAGDMPESSIPDMLCFETLIAGENDDHVWPVFDENSASTLCYTSGTTGNPKGVLYSHRSTILHAFGGVAADGMRLAARDSILLATPLFHVNAWGVPYSAAMCGAKLVLPGPRLDGASLFTLLRDEGCTFTLGVPTLWLGLLEYVERNVPEAERRALRLERVLCGGSAAPRALIERFDRVLGVELIHAWGMTETSPLATINRPLDDEPTDREQLYDERTNQGRAIYGVELKIIGDDGDEVDRDGASAGDLLVRGPWIAERYFGDETSATDENGWFATGDVARLSPTGFLQITDRSKDVIKSGGEWISSIDLENAAVGHPLVAEAAVIGVPHPRWQERPLLLIRASEAGRPDPAELLEYLAGHVARWWLPDEILFVDELPHTATGKLLKTKLRETYRDHYAAAPAQA